MKLRTATAPVVAIPRRTLSLSVPLPDLLRLPLERVSVALCELVLFLLLSYLLCAFLYRDLRALFLREESGLQCGESQSQYA